MQFEYTNNTAPLISISGDSHKAVLGCTPVGSVAPIKYVKVRNQGASDLTISKLSGVTAFSLMKSVTIPQAHWILSDCGMSERAWFSFGEGLVRK